MANVVVVGLGNIGTKHIQALGKYSDGYTIYGVEANQGALERAENSLSGIVLLNSIDKLPSIIDLCIIATSSGPRREVFERISELTTVKNVIFEKVLFQRKKDYEEVFQILKNKKINAWVNCPRREQHIYNNIKDRFREEKWKYFSVSGGGWGLCCNGIHMIDLIQYLSGCNRIQYTSNIFIPGIYDSKRTGYKEMFGTIGGMCGDDILFQISCTKDAITPIMLVLSSDNVQLIIEEGKKKAHIATRENEWQWETIDFNMEYQSDLTGRVAESILKKGVCNLPTYEMALETHSDYIEMWIKEFKLQGWECDLCPIT